MIKITEENKTEKKSNQPVIRSGLALTCSFVFVFLILSLSPVTARATIIRLREKVQTNSALISLGDVAEIVEADQELIKKLKRITLAPAPATGRTLRVNIDRIRRELTLRGFDQSELSFVGSSESLISNARASSPVKTGMRKHDAKKVTHLLSSSISNYLQQQSPELGAVTVIFSEEHLQIIRSRYDFSHQIEVRGGQHPWTGMQRFQISFVDRQGRSQNLPLVCNVTRKQQILALKLGLPRGKVIREGDLIWVDATESSTLFNAESTFSELKDVVGTETKRNVRAQTPLHPSDIRQLPLVKRNDIVAVTVHIGGVVVRRYCKSHDEGTKGQFISLTPVDGKEKVTAMVSGFREAVIALDVPSSPQQSSNPIENVSYKQPIQQISNRRLQIRKPQGNSQQVAPASEKRSSFRHRPEQINAVIQANRPVQLPQ